MNDQSTIEQPDIPQPEGGGDDPKKKLWQGLHSDGLYTKSYDEFKQKYSSPDKVDALFSGLAEDGSYTKTKDDFYNQYFPDISVKKKDGGQPSTNAGNIFSTGATSSRTQAEDEALFNTNQNKEVGVAFDPKDPVKSYKNNLMSKTTRFGDVRTESVAQNSLSGSNKVAAKSEPESVLPTTAKKALNAIKQNIFPTTHDAVNWMDQHAGEIQPDNETAKVAVQKINRRREVDDLWNNSLGFNDFSAKLFKEDPTDIGEAKQGKLVYDALHSPEVIEKAHEDPEFAKFYNNENGNFYNNHPITAKTNLMTKISQKMEDEHMTGWLFADATVEKTDKAMQMLVDSGEVTPQDANLYSQWARPIIESGNGQDILATTDAVNKFLQGASKGIAGMESSVRDVITNKILGGLPQDLGLIETNEDKRKRLEDEQYSTVTVNPKGEVRKAISMASEFGGFTIPMIIGSGLGIPQATNMALMFEGNNADKARELFKNDGGKQNLYTLLTTGFDMFAMGKLKTPDAAANLTGAMKERIASLVNQLSDKTITNEVAKQTFTTDLKEFSERVAKLGLSVVKGNVHTANVLTGFDIAHNVIDAAFGKRDFSVEKELNDAVSGYKYKFLSGTFLSMMGASAGGNKEMVRSSGRVLRELATNADAVREQIKNDPEKLKNLDLAVKINQALNERIALNDEREKDKDRFMGEAMKEALLKEKEKNTPSEALKADIKKDIKESQITQAKILNPDMGNKEFVEEMYNEGLLDDSPYSKRSLENNKTGKFDENKVGIYLKEVAQQANGLDENWQPLKGGKPSMDKIPEQIIDAANERWAKEIEPAKPKEESFPEGKQDIPQQTDIKPAEVTPTQLETDQKVNDLEEQKQREITEVVKPKLELSYIDEKEFLKKDNARELRKAQTEIRKKESLLKKLLDCE